MGNPTLASSEGGVSRVLGCLAESMPNTIRIAESASLLRARTPPPARRLGPSMSSPVPGRGQPEWAAQDRAFCSDEVAAARR